MNQGKKILDMTCGSRTIWFDKNDPNTVFCDKRHENHELYFGKNHTSLHTCSVEPDVQCDFTDLPFEDNTFSLVIFDPPHLLHAKDTAWLVKKYGKLDDTWPQMLHDGFAEGMRVLKPDGVLIFKWSEYDIPAVKVWKAIGQKPLFGHHSGRKSKTFWGCFMKNEEEVAREQLANNPPELDKENGELISRQAALDALEKSRFPGAPYIDRGILIALKEIKKLPPAQPEIIYCRDCRHLANKSKDGGTCWQANGFSSAMRYYDFCSRAERRTDG